MDAQTNDNLNFRQAIAGKWQMPLFVFSILLFAAVLVLGRPSRPAAQEFDEKLKALELLSREGRFSEFYVNADDLRLELLEKDYNIETQFAQLRLLSASTRVSELTEKQEFSTGTGAKVGARENYNDIIRHYEYALSKGLPGEDSPELAKIYYDLSLSYYKVKDFGKALAAIKRARELMPEFRSGYLRDNIEMNYRARVENYLSENMALLEAILANEQSGDDDRAWAFVARANVLLQSGREKEALVWLDGMPDMVKDSQYGLEARFLRGKALRRDGQVDRADIELRQLLDELPQRDDVYAQTALELGHINYMQYRDYQARIYYRRVVDTQIGKDWYMAGKLGLAQCSALQQRYDQAILDYQEVIEEYFKNPDNQAMSKEDLQMSLIGWAETLSMQRQYSTALMFLELEQKIADAKDGSAAYRFALVHWRLGNQLLEEFAAVEQEKLDEDINEDYKLWQNQQQEIISRHFGLAGQYFLRVANLSLNNNELYSDSLWDSASSYDKAGNPEKAAEVWKTYIGNNREQQRWPRAVFNLAQAYQSMAKFDLALEQYGVLLRDYPMFSAAYDAVIPMAHCYLSKADMDKDKADENLDKAKDLLLSVLNNPALTPRSKEYQQAMFLLGELYYKREQYRLSIKYLTEAIARYPDDQDLGKMMFLVGDSYRRNGLMLDEQLRDMPADDPAAALTRDKIFVQRSEQLSQALDYFNQAVNFYAQIPENRHSKRDKLYYQLSWLHRADSLFDLGDYRQASESYQDVISQFDKTTVSLMAFVQLINCYVKLEQPIEASMTLNKANWQLQAMADDVLGAGLFGMDRLAWQQWFDWLADSGLVN